MPRASLTGPDGQGTAPADIIPDYMKRRAPWRLRSGNTAATPRLQSERLDLLVLDQSHAQEVLDYYRRNREFLAPWVPRRPPEFFTKRYQQQLLARDRAEALERTKLPLWLRRRSDGMLLGSAVFSTIVYGSFRSCMLGYNLDTTATGQGFMTEGLRTALPHVFTKLGLHRVEANVMPRNAASLGLLRKLGFRLEGYSPRYLEIAGAWEDHLRLALLEEEYRDSSRA